MEARGMSAAQNCFKSVLDRSHASNRGKGRTVPRNCNRRMDYIKTNLL